MLYVSIELFHLILIDFYGFCNRFGDFYKSITDRQTDGPTDQRTDGPTDQQTDIPSYRDAIAASKNVDRPNSRYKEFEGTDWKHSLLRIFDIAISYCFPYGEEVPVDA